MRRKKIHFPAHETCLCCAKFARKNHREGLGQLALDESIWAFHTSTYKEEGEREGEGAGEETGKSEHAPYIPLTRLNFALP